MNRIAITSIFLLAGVFAFGQGNNHFKGFSVRAGFGSTGIANQNNYGQRELDYGLYTGFSLGVDYLHQLSAKGFFQIGLGFAQGGQDYSDSFSNGTYEKQVSYQVYSLPFLYRHVFKKYNEEYLDHKTRLYIQGGFEGTMLSGAKLDHQIDGSAVNFKDFLLTGIENQHMSFISSQSRTDDDLYEKIGLGVIGGFGLEQKLNNQNRLFFELRGGISILDINASEWRLENREGVYGASRNAYLQLNVGLVFGGIKNN